MLAGVSFILGIYSGMQALYNFWFSHRKRKYSSTWTGQERNVCKKTCYVQTWTSISMILIGIVFSIIGK